MTVATTIDASGPYYPNGATVAFPFLFDAGSIDDVEVVIVAADGSETTVSSALYTVTLAGGDAAGGTVTYAAAPAALAVGSALWVVLSPSFEQMIGFVDEGAFNQSMLNPMADEGARRSIWLRSRLGRALLSPYGEAGIQLPVAASRANTVMHFDGAGALDLIPDSQSSEVAAQEAALQAEIYAAQAAAAAGALTLKNYYVDPRLGNDVNVGTRAAPFATLVKAGTVAAAGDTIWILPGVVKENFAYLTQVVPDGVRVRIHGGGKALFEGFDKYAGAWTANAGAYYTAVNIAHLFGGVGVKVGAGRIYPGAIYREGAGKAWKQLRWKYRNEFASDAAGIAYVQANAGYGYIEDMSATGSSFTAGWQTGNFRYHVNLGGVDPATCQWLVHQRYAPFFGRNHYLEGLIFFGNLSHDGLAIRASHLQDIEVAYPRFHGGEITGCTYDGLTFRNGNANGAGYAHHLFDGSGANWPLQRVGGGNGLRIINWPGATIGCHASDAIDGGGGAGFVTALLIVNDPYFENVDGIGNGGSVTNGIVLNRPVFNRIGSIGGSGWNMTINEPRITQAHPVTDWGIYSSNQRLFGSGSAGYKLTVNGGFAYHSMASQLMQASGGALELKRLRCLFSPEGFGDSFILHGADHQGVTIDGCAIQYEGYGDRSANAACTGSGHTAGRPVTITNSHLGGIQEGFAGLAGVTIDEHSFIGGHTGLAATGDPFAPILTPKTSTWWGLGERTVGLSFGVGNGRNWGQLTSRGLYMSSAGVAQWTLPAGFTPRGIVGMWFTNAFTYVYGLGGKLYKANGTGALTLVATGTVKDFTGHLKAGALVFLGCSDGTLYKLDTATDTVTLLTSNVAFRILGGIQAGGTVNLLMYGYDANEGAGGYLYSTDSGVTWTAGTGTAAKISCAAYVNGTVLMSGLAGTFFTGATVGGAMTAQNGYGGPEVKSMTVDATNKRVLIVGTARGGGGAIGKRNGRWSTVGFLEASDAVPANWRYKGRAAPLAAPLIAANSEGGNFDGLVTYTEYAVASAIRGYASIETVDGTDWAYLLPRPELTGMADTRIDDEYGYQVAS